MCSIIHNLTRQVFFSLLTGVVPSNSTLKMSKSNRHRPCIAHDMSVPDQSIPSITQCLNTSFCWVSQGNTTHPSDHPYLRLFHLSLQLYPQGPSLAPVQQAASNTCHINTVIHLERWRFGRLEGCHLPECLPYTPHSLLGVVQNCQNYQELTQSSIFCDPSQNCNAL